MLGICLGAQLLADVLGGEVTRAPYEEIGWHPVELTEAGRRLEVFAHFPDRFTTLQWHGDTFSIPPGAIHAAFSRGHAQPGFHVRRRAGHRAPVPPGGDPADAGGTGGGRRREPARQLSGTARGPWVSPLEDLLAPDAPFDACRELLFGLLDRMVMR